MPPQWRLLRPRTLNTTLPPLLISAEFSPNAYTVNITDLSYLWSESLDRRGIIKRSLDVDTSIDPSEDAQQMSVFLDKIQSAVGSAKKTSLSVAAQPDETPATPPLLKVDITVELPKGLRPLRWPLFLKPLPQSSFSSRLLFPVLQAHHARIQEQEELVRLLKDKDHVIQKLVDRLETTGAELGHIFPAAAGKGGRKVPRQVAEERVKGLRPFDAEEWMKGMRTRERQDGAEDMTSTVVKAFGASGGPALNRNVNQESTEPWASWWTQVKNDPIELSTSKVEDNVELKSGEHAVHGRQNAPPQDGDEDFQIQLSPPRLSTITAPKAKSLSSSPTIPSQAIAADSTDDEDDLDGPSQPSAIPDSLPRSPPGKHLKKPGTIGRPKPVPNTSAVPTAQTATQVPWVKAFNSKLPNTADDDDETASEDDEDPKQPPSSNLASKETSAPPAQPKKGFTLGRIGGKSKQATPEVFPDPDPHPHPHHRPSPPPTEAQQPLIPSSSPKPKPKSKLGIIGRKGKATSTTTDPEEKVESSMQDVNVDNEKTGAIMWGRGEEVMERKQDGERRDGREVERDEMQERERERERERETSLERADRRREELKRELGEKTRVPVRKKRKF